MATLALCNTYSQSERFGSLLEAFGLPPCFDLYFRVCINSLSAPVTKPKASSHLKYLAVGNLPPLKCAMSRPRTPVVASLLPIYSVFFALSANSYTPLYSGALFTFASVNRVQRFFIGIITPLLRAMINNGYKTVNSPHQQASILRGNYRLVMDKGFMVHTMFNQTWQTFRALFCPSALALSGELSKW